MKPIRKDEQEYLRTYIGRKFDNRRSALESERQVDVDQEVDKNLHKFRKMLNIEKLIKDVQKASDEYEDFVTNYEARKATKKDSLYKLGSQLQKKLSKWQSIRRWEKSPSFITHNTERDELPVDMDDAIKYIATVCEEETIKAYDRSKKGIAIRSLDAQKEEAENALYSGGSMVDVRQYIHNIFNTAGIADRVAKSLLMLSK